MGLISNKILAVVLSYYPDSILLRSNIDAIIKDVDKVIIWENTPVENRCQYRFIENSKVEYVGSDVNDISVALNFAWGYAQKYGYSYLLTMDQDSVFENFGLYISKSLEIFEEGLCIISPSVNSSSKEINIINKETVITSGMIVPVDLLEKVHGWRIDFKIDAIDIDFCLKAAAYGFPIYQITGCCLRQRFGNPEKRNVFGKDILIHNYNPSRLYGYAKNMYITLSEHGFPKSITTRYKKAIRNTLFNIILFEESKYKKIKAIVRGLIDGIAYTRA